MDNENAVMWSHPGPFKATHMVWEDQNGRFRQPAMMVKQTLQGLNGRVLCAWSEERKLWALNGLEVKVVPVRHRPGRYDRIYSLRDHDPAELDLVILKDPANGKPQLYGAKERPWYLRDTLAHSGRLEKPLVGWPTPELWERAFDRDLRARMIQDGRIKPKEIFYA